MGRGCTVLSTSGMVTGSFTSIRTAGTSSQSLPASGPTAGSPYPCVVDVLCADDDEAAAEAGVEADGRCELGHG